MQRHTPAWSAHVALPAHPPVVFLIAEVRDEVHHPAAAARRIARDQIQLLALVLSLRQVRPLPVRSCASRVFGGVHPRPTVDPKLLQRAVQPISVQRQGFLQFLARLRFVAQRLPHPLQHRDFGILAVEEEFVCLAIRPP